LRGAGVVHRHAEFGREHDVLAPVAEALAQILLGAAALAVDIRGVEQRDAEIERPVHDLARRRKIEPAAEIVATQPDQRDLQAGSAEISYLHARPLFTPDRPKRNERSAPARRHPSDQDQSSGALATASSCIDSGAMAREQLGTASPSCDPGEPMPGSTIAPEFRKRRGLIAA